MVGLGPVPIDADDIVGIDRSFPLGPKLFFKDGRWLITTPEALARLEWLRAKIILLDMAERQDGTVKESLQKPAGIIVV
jgi:hypothetical protein